MPASPPYAWRGLAPGLALGAVAGAVAAAVAALTAPELYVDWGALPAILVVIPLFSVGAALLAAVPLAFLGRITWPAAAVAVLASLLVGELVFAYSRRTPFASWSASRHWAAQERRAAAEREASERETCRRLLAEAPIPPPPAPPGAAPVGPAPRSAPAPGASLMAFSRERCAELLGQ